MKQSPLLLLPFVVFLGCTNGPKQDEAKTDSTTKNVPLVYPFTPKYSLNWQPGDEKNAVLVLGSFKKYLDGDVKGAFADFADSFEFKGNKFHFIGKKDSLEAMFTPMRASLASMSIKPDTWMTTYYPDYKDTWVTIWSTEYYTDKKGKSDSVYIVQDVLVKDGKIAQIDEKQRLFPEAPMKK
jgi:hypothetical protein